MKGNEILTAQIYGIRAKDRDRYFYVGSTKHSLARRLMGHKDSIRRGSNKNRHFVRTVNGIGLDSLVIEQIEECPAEHRFERERHWINKLSGLTNIVTNPACITLARIATRQDVEQALERVKNGPQSRLTGLAIEYAEQVLRALQAIERRLAEQGLSHLIEAGGHAET